MNKTNSRILFLCFLICTFSLSLSATTYDANGNQTQVTDPNGNSTRYYYSLTDRLIRTEVDIETTIDPTGNQYQYEFDQYGKISSAISPLRDESGNQRITNYAPESVQGVINSLPPGTGTPENPVPAVMVDDCKSTVTDAKGYIESILTNPQGQTVKTTDPINRQITLTRDSNGLITQRSGVGMPTVNMVYDSKGNLTQTTQVQSGGGGIPLVTKFTYEPLFNQITGITDPNNNWTRINYDTYGNPIEIFDAQNNKTTIEYNTKGLPTSIWDAKNNLTTFDYDPTTYNLLQITDPLLHSTYLEYDIAGNVISTTDAADRTTQFNYNSINNRLSSVVDALNQTTGYLYNLRGDLLSVTDARNKTTLFEYNEIGLLKRVTNPLDQVKQFFYDVNKNLVKTIDAKGQTIILEYDQVNRLINKTLPGSLITHYEYNTMDNLTLATDPDSQVLFGYDAFGMLSYSYSGGAPDPRPYQQYSGYTYDKNGNRLTMTDPVGTTNYVWDTLNRIVGVK